MEERQEEKIKRKYSAEIIAVIVCCLGNANCGLAVTWISPALPQMKAEGGIIATLGPNEQSFVESWMAGGLSLGALICTPVSAIVTEILGRKLCAMIAGVPFVINSLAILITSNIYILLAARIFMGIGLSLVLANMQPFIGETASPEIRGRLSSLMIIFRISGMISANAVGGFLSYKAAAMVMLVVSLASIILFFFIPETPVWLVKKGNIKKAVSSIAWYHRVQVDDPIVFEELDKIQKVAKETKLCHFQTAKQLVLSKPLRRGFLICTVVMFLQCWTGLIAIPSYSVAIFMQSGAASLTPEGAATVYGCIQLLGAIASTVLIDKLGRKVLMTISTLGVTLCMVIMGIYFQMQSSGHDLKSMQWLPVLALSVCAFTFTIGLEGLPFIFIVDLLTHEVRSLATICIMLVLNANYFVLLLFFGRALAAFGEHPVFYFFGSVCVVTCLYNVFFIPETKGKSYDEIQHILSK